MGVTAGGLLGTKEETQSCPRAAEATQFSEWLMCVDEIMGSLCIGCVYRLDIIGLHAYAFLD